MAVWEWSDGKTSRFLVKALQSFSRISSVFVILIGVAVLLGWVFGLDFLKSVLPSSVTMKVNTALGLLFSGIALQLRAILLSQAVTCSTWYKTLLF